MNAYIGSIDNDFDGQLIYHITQRFEIEEPVLRHAVEYLRKVGTLTINNVMNDLIKQSLVFDPERYEIIEKAIHFFINNEYWVFIYLIIPQIEAAICNLVEKRGLSVIKPQKKGDGFQLKVLDELLREKVVSDVFTEDGAYYLRLVLTDQRSLNLRNLICHGIVSPSIIGYGEACRLLHVLVMLGLVRIPAPTC